MKTKQTMIQSMIQSIQSAFALLFAMLFALQALPILAQAPVAAIPDQAQKSAVTTTVANVMLDTLKPSTVRYGAFAGFGVYSLSNIAELSSGIPQLLTSPILPYIQQGLPFSLRAGGLVELPFGEGWGFQGRLEISRLEAIMQSLEKVPSRVGSNKVETINVTHNLAAEIWSASLSALMVFRPLRFLSLMAGVDVHGAFSSTIKTSEKLNSNAV